jgi:hypothetical protein
MKSSEKVAVTMVRDGLPPSTPAAHLSKAVWNRVGRECVLELGHFDIPSLRSFVDSARDAGPSPQSPISLYVTGRYVLTPPALLDLLSTTLLAARDFVAQGAITEAELQAVLEAKDGPPVAS